MITVHTVKSGTTEVTVRQYDKEELVNVIAAITRKYGDPVVMDVVGNATLSWEGHGMMGLIGTKLEELSMTGPKPPGDCRRCAGSGKYRLVSGRLVDCFACDGTGVWKGPRSPVVDHGPSNDAINRMVERERQTATSPFNGATVDLSGVAATVAARPRTTFTQPKGYYTVVLEDDSHVTLRVSDWKSKPGTIIVAFLDGPDNTGDYQGFASFDTASGTGGVWKRFENGYERQRKALEILAAMGTEDIAGAREGYAMRSGRCAICGRMLTVPASIHRGIGPECAAKAGI